MNTSERDIKKILEDYKKITVLGLSPDFSKPSHRIPVFMRSKGYDIAGVYPNEKETDGFKIFQSLAQVPEEQRQFVNVFRGSEKIPMIVDEIIRLGGVKVLWLQLGIENAEAEKRAEQAGILVVSNRCLLIEYNKYF